MILFHAFSSAKDLSIAILTFLFQVGVIILLWNCRGTRGDVDVPYLDRIQHEVRPETKWMIYYHSEDDLKRLKSVFGITGISRKFEVYFLKSDNFWDR